MLDFSDRKRTGISILTSAILIMMELISLLLQRLSLRRRKSPFFPPHISYIVPEEEVRRKYLVLHITRTGKCIAPQVPTAINQITRWAASHERFQVLRDRRGLESIYWKVSQTWRNGIGIQSR